MSGFFSKIFGGHGSGHGGGHGDGHGGGYGYGNPPSNGNMPPPGGTIALYAGQ